MNRRRGSHFDVCVVGGGPAGAAAAISARATGAVVGLIAPQPHPAPGSLEVIASRARATLDALGVLDLVAANAEPCIGTVARWSGDGFDETSCLLDPAGAGWIVDRRHFDGVLASVAAQRGVSIVAERVLEVGPSGRIRLRERDVAADDVIVAVGRGRGPVRPNVDRKVRHRIVALDARLAADAISGLGRRLLVDRAPNGFWYALGDNATTHAVYCTDAALLSHVGVGDAWREACRSAVDWLPVAAVTTTPRVRPATVGTAGSTVHGSVRLVGDIALAVDPLSGHGVALALQAASRWNDDGYADWIVDTGRAHERTERDVYRAACGPVDGPFWTRRR